MTMSVITVSVYAVLLFLLSACELPDPAQIRKNQFMPPKSFVPNVKHGLERFNALCQSCHGIAAQGSRSGPPLVDTVYLPDHHADQAFRWAVRDGVKQHHWHFGDMPKIKNATPEDVGHIIAYVRQLQQKQLRR